MPARRRSCQHSTAAGAANAAHGAQSGTASHQPPGRRCPSKRHAGPAPGARLRRRTTSVRSSPGAPAYGPGTVYSHSRRPSRRTARAPELLRHSAWRTHARPHVAAEPRVSAKHPHFDHQRDLRRGGRVRGVVAFYLLRDPIRGWRRGGPTSLESRWRGGRDPRFAGVVARGRWCSTGPHSACAALIEGRFVDRAATRWTRGGPDVSAPGAPARQAEGPPRGATKALPTRAGAGAAVRGGPVADGAGGPPRARRRRRKAISGPVTAAQGPATNRGYRNPDRRHPRTR
jgi:hypothetical protein